MPIDFKALNKMDIAIKSTRMTPEEQAEFSKFLAEYKKKNAKVIARIDAKLKKKKTSAKAKKK
jgi:hypothetical protein